MKNSVRILTVARDTAKDQARRFQNLIDDRQKDIDNYSATRDEHLAEAAEHDKLINVVEALRT